MEVLLDSIFSPQTLILVFVVVLLKTSIKSVPQNRVFVIERFGKFQSSKEAGLNFILPFVDRISADRSLKEQAVDVPQQSAITKDNISLGDMTYCKTIKSSHIKEIGIVYLQSPIPLPCG